MASTGEKILDGIRDHLAKYGYEMVVNSENDIPVVRHADGARMCPLCGSKAQPVLAVPKVKRGNSSTRPAWFCADLAQCEERVEARLVTRRAMIASLEKSVILPG